MASIDRPSLETLPQEVFDQIFSHLLSSWGRSNFPHLVALRQTCRRLHNATQARLFPLLQEKLKDATFHVTFESLSTLLHFTTVPQLRDCIINLSLIHGLVPTLGCENRWRENDNSKCEGHEASPNEPWAWREHYIRWTERQEHEESSTTYHLISQILANLKVGQKLAKFEFEAGWEVVLAALEANDLDRNLKYVKKVWKGRNLPGDNPMPIIDYIRDHGFRDGYTHDLASTSPSTPSLQNVMHRTSNGGLVTVNGYGADIRHLWSKIEGFMDGTIKDVFFPVPHTLSLYDVSVSGILLKNYLKRVDIGTRLDLIHVKLTAGSWRKVFKAIREGPTPDYLSLAHLWQRARDGKVSTAKEGKLQKACSSNRIGCSRYKITAFLQEMGKQFRTRSVKGTFWFEVELLVVSGWGNYENAIDVPIRMEFDLTKNSKRCVQGMLWDKAGCEEVAEETVVEDVVVLDEGGGDGIGRETSEGLDDSLHDDETGDGVEETSVEQDLGSG